MNSARKLLFVLLLGLLFPLWTAAQELPRALAVPGGIAIVNLGAAAQKPEAHYKGKRVLVSQHQEEWLALVGLNLATKPGRHTLRTYIDGREGEQHFTVSDKQYEEQHITLKNKRMVDPYAQDLERIRADQARSRVAFASWDGAREAELGFATPVTGRLSGTFGKRRFFNGQPRNPHSGLDIAAPTGTPILAPAAGIITESGDYFFNGNTLFIDHGEGLITMFCHMDSIAVKVGQRVARGETVGTVGMTGRVTGPHLHWTISLNNNRIDPGLFLSRETMAALDAPNHK
ncbi:MAG: peptidoglycan DD-metalloendopeptidase family protein [Gammaproteobacteria bacterium]|nr:peptidoglycan DD-metalloendopeptidase family protein [Gammaproteobacteria bacterium]